MHALFKRQVECKVTPVTGLFSLRLPEFESDQAGKLNRPAVMLRQPPCRQRQPKSLSQLHILHPQLEREPSRLRRFGQIDRKSPGKTGGFRSQRIPQFESYHPSHAVCLGNVQKRRC
jgi:hypothetical protein